VPRRNCPSSPQGVFFVLLVIETGAAPLTHLPWSGGCGLLARRSGATSRVNENVYLRASDKDDEQSIEGGLNAGTFLMHLWHSRSAD
jgi:hypothetical protein